MPWLLISSWMWHLTRWGGLFLGTYLVTHLGGQPIANQFVGASTNLLIASLWYAGLILLVIGLLTSLAARAIAGRFDVEEVAANYGLYDEAGACYILCVIARKPF